MQHIRPILMVMVCCLPVLAGTTTGSDTNRPGASAAPLTLTRAVELTLSRNPELRARLTDLEITRSRVRQAGFRPNPILSVDSEGIAGTGSLRGFESAETTILLSQPLELGGKRDKRTRLAQADSEVLRRDLDIFRQELALASARAFVGVLAAQERLRIRDQLLELADRIRNVVNQRVESGKASPIETTKADVTRATSRLEREQARNRLEQARQELAALWGMPVADFSDADGRLTGVPAPPPLAVLHDHLADTPEMRRWRAERRQREAGLDLARAGRIPDVEVGAGIKHLGEAGDTGFVLGVSIPLPVFDRHREEVRRAVTGLTRSDRDRLALQTTLDSRLRRSWQDLTTAYLTIQRLEEDILPGARQAFDAIREGYRYGKFSYLEVLETQRTLTEAELQHIDALAAYHLAAMDINRLAGWSFDSGLGLPNLNQEENRHER